MEMRCSLVWLLVLMLAIPGCDTREQRPPSPLPVHRTITDSKGRTLDAKIIGKDDESVTFIRESDGKRYTIPISRLVQEDQVFLRRFKNRTPKKEEVEKSEPDPQFVASRKQELEKLRKRVARLKQEANSPALDNMVRRRRARQVHDTLAEIEKIKLSIEDYKWRMKLD